MKSLINPRKVIQIEIYKRFTKRFKNYSLKYKPGDKIERKYFFGLIISPYLGWSLGTLLGALAGNILPLIVVSALGVAIYAMFIAIIVPEMKKKFKTALAAFSGIALSCLFFYTPVLNKIPSGFVIVICAVTVSALFAIFAPIPDEEEAEA